MVILAIIEGYLLGSLSISICVSKLLGADVRQKGSGNAGATNMARVYGIWAGLLTLSGDMLKALLAMYIGKLLLGEPGIAYAGIGCMVGHCWPVFHGFRGGKGISAGAMVALMVDWRIFALIIVIFAIVAVTSKKVSAASVSASVMLSVLALLFSVQTPKLILALCSTAIAVYRHKENIKRLINGTEPDFKAAGKNRRR